MNRQTGPEPVVLVGNQWFWPETGNFKKFWPENQILWCGFGVTREWNGNWNSTYTKGIAGGR